jgi:F-type H+-transporting ATPase subunit epsilon
MATFSFELVSPDKLLFKGDAESVLVPGSEGDFLVLRDHAPVMTSLRPGLVEVDQGGGKRERYFVRGGFADANPAGLILLADTAVPAHELTPEWIAGQITFAETELQGAEDEPAKLKAQGRLDRLRELKESLKL